MLVQVPGISDVERLKKLIGETGKLEFRMVDPAPMRNRWWRPSRFPSTMSSLYIQDTPPVPYVIKKQVLVSGENLVDSQPGFDQRTNEPIVTFRFDATGAKRFARATQENVGLPFAIILDGKVVSAPVIRESRSSAVPGRSAATSPCREASDLAVTAAVRRASRQAHRDRGAYRRRKPRRRLDRLRHEGRRCLGCCSS